MEEIVKKESFDIEAFKSLVSTAPAILTANKLSLTKAIARGDELIALAELGMTAELDKLLADYIAKINVTVKNMNKDRSPITQILTAVAKEFTSLETDVKVPVIKCQAFRDSHATTLMNERLEKERIAALKLAKEQEAIEIVRLYTVKHAEAYSKYLLEFKTAKNEWFNSLTLETIEMAALKIALFDNNLSDGTFMFNIINTTLWLYHTESEYNEIVPAISLCYGALDKFKVDMSEYKRELIDLIPSKKIQLEELETARLLEVKAQEDEAERVRLANIEKERLKKLAEQADAENKIILDAQLLETERLEKIKTDKAAEEKKVRDALAEKEANAEKLRQAEISDKLLLEAKETQQKTVSQANVQATSQSASAMVDNRANLFTEAPKIKEGYSILVTDPEAYLLLVQFWFENEGKSLSIEKIENKSIAQIKAFCEKWAAKNDEMIDSKLITYKPIYKAK